MMTCECDALKAEIMSQRELMVGWFQTLRVEIQDAKAEIVELIKANTFNVGKQQKTNEEPLTGQQSSIAEPISANEFLERITSPLQCGDFDSNPVLQSLERTRNPEMEPTPDPTFKNKLISPKIEPMAEELALKFTQSDCSDQTLAEKAKAISAFNLFGSVDSASLSAITVENEQIKMVSAKKSFACNQCKYRCTTEGNLIRHKRFHTGQKQLLSCKQCSFSADNYYKLKMHLRVHIGEKPFACDQCDFRANQKGTLEIHELIHTGEKPFACDQCDYRSSRKDTLDNHRRIHTGEKSFACDQCDYRCSRNCTLERHRRIHTGEKPFQCGLCDYRAVSSSTLIKHIKNKHEPQK